MKTPSLLLLLLLLCLCPSARAQVRITEVNPTTDTVELTNFGAVQVNLATWQWCRQRFYSPVGGTIAAGQSRTFTVSMTDASSDMCLYKSSLFDSTTDMEDFVQWGAAFPGFNGRQDTAVAKGIWTAGQFFPAPPAGQSLHAKGQAPATGLRMSNWFTGYSHLGSFPVPAPEFESVAITGGQWRIIAKSYHLPAALRTEANTDLGVTWFQQTPLIIDLGSGRLDIRFTAATGPRQFVRIRAQP